MVTQNVFKENLHKYGFSTNLIKHYYCNLKRIRVSSMKHHFTNACLCVILFQVLGFTYKKGAIKNWLKKQFK